MAAQAGEVSVRAFAVVVTEIEGEKNEQFVTEGKYALLRRIMFSMGEAATAVVRVSPMATHAEVLWTDDAPKDQLEEWQRLLMESVENDR